MFPLVIIAQSMSHFNYIFILLLILFSCKLKETLWKWIEFYLKCNYCKKSQLRPDLREMHSNVVIIYKLNHSIICYFYLSFINLVAKYSAELQLLYKKNDISPLKSFLVPLAQVFLIYLIRIVLLFKYQIIERHRSL